MMRTGKKKIAIVTGASSGMGRECVIQLADRFAGLEEIWVIARRGRRLDKLAGKVPVPLRVLELIFRRSWFSQNWRKSWNGKIRR